MEKVTLLKQVGDHQIGDEIEINDQSVIDAWKNLGVIDGGEKSLSDYTVKELQALAGSRELPKEEWEGFKKAELVEYLTQD